MKMNIRGWLLAPWIVLFTLIIAGIIIGGSRYHLDLRTAKFSTHILVFSILICLYFNFKTITKAGIWISYSVPKYLKPNSWHWLVRTFFASIIAYGFYKVGQISWIPLYWQGFVLPIVFSLVLVTVIASVLSPILIWCSNLPFTRLAALLGSAPVLLLIPLSGVFIGEMILRAYEASLPKPLILEYKAAALANELAILEETNKNNLKKSDKSKKGEGKNSEGKSDSDKTDNEKLTNATGGAEGAASIETNLLDPRNDKAKKFKALVLSKVPCSEEAALIQSALHEKNPDEIAYWATKAVSCANLRPIAALTKLVDIMLKHKNPEVRASAIMAMSNFKTEIVQNLGYLLVKQISERQAPVVIEAAASVFSRLGGTEYNWTMRKLKVLLAHPTLHRNIADIMVRVMNREDLIFEYIVTSLTESTERTPIKMAAIEMVCSLPKKSLSEMGPHVSSIVALISSGDDQDPAKRALDCMGSPGINAIREEIKTPKILPRVAAVKVLSNMNIKNSKEVLETVSGCIHDDNEQIRKLCSTSLGKVGAPALPKIIELMNASKDEDKFYGESALSSLVDPEAKHDLLAIRARNSGWAATQKKLRLVRSIDTTLVRIEDIQGQVLKQKRLQEERQTVPIKKKTTL
jgi:HEAT repeat protein